MLLPALHYLQSKMMLRAPTGFACMFFRALTTRPPRLSKKRWKKTQMKKMSSV
jgi:hypothetical protein